MKFKRVEKKEGFKVSIGDYTFRISTFCYQKVGDTENMKFRMTCDEDEAYGGEFDDFESLKNYLVKFLQEDLFDYMILAV